MLKFFQELPNNFWRCFRWRYMPWHILAMVLTYNLVRSGFDGAYFAAGRTSAIYWLLAPAGALGSVVTVALPLLYLLVGALKRSAATVYKGWALGQAVIIALALSFAYKIVTGRPGPPAIFTPSAFNLSEIFRFGLGRGGIIWGWPSTHTTVAVALAFTFYFLYHKTRRLKYAGFIYAAYIAAGVSVSIHWFSDVIAGLIFGTIVGLVVGRGWAKS